MGFGIDDDGNRLDSVTPLARSVIGEILEEGKRIEASGEALDSLASDIGSVEAVVGIPLSISLHVEKEVESERRRLHVVDAKVAVGALVLEFDLGDPEEESFAPLELLAEMAASAIRREQSHGREVLGSKVSMAGPTELWTRLEEEIRANVSPRVPFALLLLRIDEGTESGSRSESNLNRSFWIEVGKALVSNSRDVDLCARMTGEEFSVLLPATDRKGAESFSERMAQVLGQLEPLDGGGGVSVSFGGAICPEDGDSGWDLMRAARSRREQARQEGGGVSLLSGEGLVSEELGIQETVDSLFHGSDVQIRERVSGWMECQSCAFRGDYEGVLRQLKGLLDVQEVSLWKGHDSRSLEGVLGLSRSGEVVEAEMLEAPPGLLRDDARRSGTPWIVGAEGEPSSLAIPLVSCGQLQGVVYLAGIDVSEEVRPIRLYLTALVSSLAFAIASPGAEGAWQKAPDAKVSERAAPLEPEAALPSMRGRLKYSYDEIIGESPAMISLLEILDKVVDSEVPVLIQGESGTGKELVARAIHRLGPRKKKSYVSENCAAVTETLLESELFGYMKGAFTGAGQDKKGLFEVADGGTLFLDEVGDMSLGMQKKLLRALQEGEIRPVGGKGVRHVNVRVLSATNRDLKKAMGEGAFREDLYYRLNVVNVVLPPLRERDGDIPLLLEFFLEKTVGELGVGSRELAAETRAALFAHDWPGNIREMENEVKRIVALGDEIITPDILSPRILENYRLQEAD
jgi:GGDEF domain-containing protein